MSSNEYRVEGATALNNLNLHGINHTVRVMAFEGGKAREARNAGRAAIPNRFAQILESSEMYCSLKFEDFRGCPYYLFSKQGIALMSVASSVLAVLSIVVAA